MICLICFFNIANVIPSFYAIDIYIFFFVYALLRDTNSLLCFKIAALIV